MQKIGDITDTADGNGEFTDGNVAGNVMPTELMAAWFTTIQREIIAVLTEAKIQPDKADDAQLLAAIKNILTKGIDGSGFLLAKNNFSDVADKATSRGHLDLKSAAILDAVTSITDTTTGRIPVVGWMGLGGSSIPISTASNADLSKLPGIPFNAFREYKPSDGSVNLIGISGISPSGNLVEWLAPENGADGKKIAVRNKDSLFILYSTANKPTANDVGALPSNGNAVSATKLATARTIGGVAFDGSANISLPGVNTQGNQHTTGNAATATKLQTARTINGVAFDGTANISISSSQVGSYTKAESDSRFQLIVPGSGAVGTYAYARIQSGNTSINFGNTVAGSVLTPACGDGSGDAGGSLSGTWRCCGKTWGSGWPSRVTLWIRIA